jgi:excinuclease UvrABC ATPase subunit
MCQVATTGELLAAGMPEQVAQVEKSYTGQCLKAML